MQPQPLELLLRGHQICDFSQDSTDGVMGCRWRSVTACALRARSPHGRRGASSVSFFDRFLGSEGGAVTGLTQVSEMRW